MGQLHQTDTGECLERRDTTWGKLCIQTNCIPELIMLPLSEGIHSPNRSLTSVAPINEGHHVQPTNTTPNTLLLNLSVCGMSGRGDQTTVVQQGL